MVMMIGMVKIYVVLNCSKDDWTCDELIEAVSKDIEDKLSVGEILEKYIKVVPKDYVKSAE